MITDKNFYTIEDLGKVYCFKTDNEFISDFIVKNNHNTIIINSLSKFYNSILLPVYLIKHKKILIKEGIDKHININNSKFLEFLISNEIKDFDFVVFGLVGLSYDGVTFVKQYSQKISKNTGKTFILVDYDPSYSKTTKTVIGKDTDRSDLKSLRS